GGGRGEAAVRTGPGWRRCFTEATSPRLLAEHVPDLVGYRRFRATLAALLDAPSDEAALVDARDARAAADPAAYLRLLLDDARVEALVVDTGFAGADAPGLAELAALAGRPAYEVVRVETVAERLLRDGVPAARFADALEERLDAALAGGAVGLKTVAAYRCGLALPEPTPAAARAALSGLDRRARLSDPVVVALGVRRAVAVAARHGRPLQVHTGFGDPDLDLTRADPALLTPLLRDRRAEDCPVVLLHCYPYVRSAAVLAAVHPQAYVDLSLAIPLAAPAAVDLVVEALALCPVSKLVAGSDGHSYPEMHWWGARVWRDALARVGAGGRVTADPPLADPPLADLSAADVAAVLGGTARRLYRLA
ncbi:MAG TPA: amidohydrolase family protein, partial [Frankiaceae bacterium]|nr:amidohydrolase family protein [Frankiaceae bacterium]